jgi:hypothetical protein
MAFNMVSDEQVQVGYLRQTTWGTAVADNGAFKTLQVPKGVFIDPAVKLSDLDLNRTSRVQNLADMHIDNFSGPVILTIPEMVMTIDRLADMVYALTQYRVSEGAATTYTKIFKMHASQPDFTNNEGYFFTLAFKTTKSGEHIKVKDCIISKMTIEWDKSGTGDKNIVRLKNVTIIGRAITFASTYSGTWVAYTLSSIQNPSIFVLTEVAATRAWLTASLTLENGAVPLGKDATGIPSTFALHPPKPGAVVFEFKTWFNAESTSINYLTTQQAKTVLAASFANTVTYNGTTGNIIVAVNGIVDGNPQANENKELMSPVKLLCGDNNTDAALSLTIIDSISQG